MNRTIAFDNTRSFWKSRYSYFSSCIAWMKNIMITAPIATSTTNLIWKHDETSLTNNSFYGQPPASSIIGVSFNDHPSANKQFKSFSIESNSPDSIDRGLNTFVINNKAGSIGKMTQKGGTLYGHIGSQDGYTLSNFEFIGVVKNRHSSKADAEEATGVDLTTDPSIVGVEFIEFDHVETNALSSVAAKVTNNPQTVKDGDGGLIATASSGPILYKGILILGETSGFSSGDGVWFAYPSSINGEAPKGQVADVTIALGHEDFEVYSVNLDYSRSMLDHNN